MMFGVCGGLTMAASFSVARAESRPLHVASSRSVPDSLRITRTPSREALLLPQGDGWFETSLADSGRVRLTVHLPDRTPSWSDGVAIFLDPVGDATPAPGHDDLQLDFRRTLDSSVVRQGVHGRWLAPGSDPDWRLGRARGMETWTVRTMEEADGWTLELLLDRAWLEGTPELAARIGLLIHDDAPNRWVAWPARDGERAAVLERMPGRWMPVRLQP
jgi:hypothetical protein